jgi:hypothetical protein
MLVNIHKLKYAMKRLNLSFFCVLLTSFTVLAQESKPFANLNEVLSFSKEKNILFKNDVIQTNLAELTRKTAIGNVLNPRIPTSF